MNFAETQRYGEATAKRRHSPGTPLSWCAPRSSNSSPDPITRSRSVLDTSTSFGPLARSRARRCALRSHRCHRRESRTHRYATRRERGGAGRMCSREQRPCRERGGRRDENRFGTPEVVEHRGEAVRPHRQNVLLKCPSAIRCQRRRDSFIAAAASWRSHALRGCPEGVHQSVSRRFRAAAARKH